MHLIGDGESTALVDRHGSIDWLCRPAFDSDTCFVALFGGPKSGRWRVAPQERLIKSTCRYRDGTLILDTTLDTEAGNVVLTDWMVRGVADPVLMRRLR
jgi:GH15 family glucan-1,4-alpha-glucosidase